MLFEELGILLSKLQHGPIDTAHRPAICGALPLPGQRHKDEEARGIRGRAQRLHFDTAGEGQRYDREHRLRRDCHRGLGLTGDRLDHLAKTWTQAVQRVRGRRRLGMRQRRRRSPFRAGFALGQPDAGGGLRPGGV